jgi:hypothetical protein
MIPNVDQTILNEFVCTNIPCKPEAPWIKRCSFGIKFTEEIQDTDNEEIDFDKFNLEDLDLSPIPPLGI